MAALIKPQAHRPKIGFEVIATCFQQEFCKKYGEAAIPAPSLFTQEFCHNFMYQKLGKSLSGTDLTTCRLYFDFIKEKSRELLENQTQELYDRRVFPQKNHPSKIRDLKGFVDWVITSYREINTVDYEWESDKRQIEKNKQCLINCCRAIVETALIKARPRIQSTNQSTAYEAGKIAQNLNSGEISHNRKLASKSLNSDPGLDKEILSNKENQTQGSVLKSNLPENASSEIADLTVLQAFEEAQNYAGRLYYKGCEELSREEKDSKNRFVSNLYPSIVCEIEEEFSSEQCQIERRVKEELAESILEILLADTAHAVAQASQNKQQRRSENNS